MAKKIYNFEAIHNLFFWAVFIPQDILSLLMQLSFEYSLNIATQIKKWKQSFLKHGKKLPINN